MTWPGGVTKRAGAPPCEYTSVPKSKTMTASVRGFITPSRIFRADYKEVTSIRDAFAIPPGSAGAAGAFSSATAAGGIVSRTPPGPTGSDRRALRRVVPSRAHSAPEWVPRVRRKRVDASCLPVQQVHHLRENPRRGVHAVRLRAVP